MCQEPQNPNCDFQCLRSQRVYLEFKTIQQTQWYPIGRADRCSLSQTCYKYKNVSVRLLEYSECLERQHTCVPEGAGLVSTICDTGFDHFQSPLSVFTAL